MKHSVPSSAPPPEEFSPAAKEFCPPPPEFGTAGDAAGTPKQRRRLRLSAAAAALLLLLVLQPRHAAAGPDEAPPALPPPAAPTEQSPSPTAPLPSVPAVSPEPTATPTPEPTAEPTPEPPPGCEIVFICFSSEHVIRLDFRAPEKIRSAEGVIWEKNFDAEELRFSVPPEDLAAGSFLYRFDESEIVFRHWDAYVDGGLNPDLELRLELQVEGDNGPETLRYTEWARPQQGWSLRYDPEDAEADDDTWPGCFVLQTYEDVTPPAIVIGEDAAVPGALCVSAEIGGQRVRAEDCRILTRDFALNDYLPPGTPKLVCTVLVIPRPADVPEGGTAHFTVLQLLDGYGVPWVTEREIEY